MDSGITVPGMNAATSSSTESKQVNESPPSFISRARIRRAKRIKAAKTFIAEVCNLLVKPRSPTLRVQRVVERVDRSVQDFHERLNGVMERK